eukprot:m.217200 g.217200  ORF g.217200 m.217200 type:complete len:106 (+) comp39879_c1_seq83:2180-2497(+)
MWTCDVGVYTVSLCRACLATYVPFCVDVQPETFGSLRHLLQEYAGSLTSEASAGSLFKGIRAQEDFVIGCLNIYRVHFALLEASSHGVNLDVYEVEINQLRQPSH